MNKNRYTFILLSLFPVIMSGCVGSKFGSAKKGEKVTMKAPPKSDVINYALLKQQQEKPLTLASRGETKTRGLGSAYAGGLVSLGVNAVKQVIANDKKKYTDQWTQGIKDLYFYDQPSMEGPFDPTGMQFNGFYITRTFKRGDKLLTSLKADFEVDKDSVQSNEIINDAVFRLKLKALKINFSKAKVPIGKDSINVDFEITFSTSYVSKDGQLNKDVELGKFYLNLRHAPLDSTSTGYKKYYDTLKNKLLDGKCFIVPRSYGYYKTANNGVVPLYNQGAFSIAVKVTESSKNSFVNEMIINTSGIGIDYEQSLLMKGIEKKLGKP